MFDRAGFDREVGVLLQLARKRSALTQDELAKKIGITRDVYANVEAGRQRIPVDIVWRASVTLGVPLSSLVPEPILQSKRTEIQQSGVPNGTLSMTYDAVISMPSLAVLREKKTA